MANEKTRGKIVDGLIELLATRGFANIGLADIARASGVSLGTLRESFDGKGAMLAEFSHRIDRAVLDGGTPEDGTPRERLFEILMRRFDALRPYAAALKNLARSARRDPALGLALSCLGVGSQKWMLEAAGIRHGGALGRFAINGAALLYANVFRVFLEDEDPGLARTMAALDRALERGERAMQFLGDFCSVPRRFSQRDRQPAAESS